MRSLRPHDPPEALHIGGAQLLPAQVDEVAKLQAVAVEWPPAHERGRYWAMQNPQPAQNVLWPDSAGAV